MKVYIAGKITGLSVPEYRAKFNACKEKVKKIYPNAEIVTPIDLCPDDMSWGDSMEICLNEIKKCNTIYMMNDWQDSKGATVEHIVAKILDINIEYESVTN